LEARGRARLRPRLIRAERPLRSSEARFDRAFHALPVPTYIWRRAHGDLVLTAYNAAAGVSSGDRAPEWVGAQATHVGLASMRQRAEALGGRCSIQTEPGNGTRVELWLPRA